MKFHIAVIQENDVEFKVSSTKEDIQNEVNKYVKIYETDDKMMMEHCIKYLELTIHQMADTEIFSESKTNIYQLCHILKFNPHRQKSINDKDKSEKDDEQLKYENNKPINNLASYLTKGNVYGKAVIFKSKIIDNRTCEQDDLKLDDITEEIWKTINHIGLKINTDGDIEEFKYTIPQLLIPKNYHFYEFELLGYSLMIFVNINFNKDKVNKIATKLNGAYLVYDDVFVLLKYNKGYTDLTLKDMDKLKEILDIPLKFRELTKEEKEEDKIDGKLIVKNRFTLLEDRIKSKINFEEKIEDWDKFIEEIKKNNSINQIALDNFQKDSNQSSNKNK